MTPPDLSAFTAEQARERLLTHKHDLERVIAEDAFPSSTALAKRYLRRVRLDLAFPILDGPNGVGAKWGPNGLGPAVRDVVAQAEAHKRMAHDASS